MKLLEIEVTDCRNIQTARLAPDEGITVIAGKNGQGKTNLLECIWLLTGGKSFRGAKDFQLVREGCEFGRIRAGFHAADRDSEILLTIGGETAPKKGRYAKMNGVDYGRASAMAGIFTAVVFDPGHLSLIKGGPAGRRRFLDAALCQLYPGYVGVLRRYTRALTQKNALLKNHFRADTALLEVFDTELAQAGEEITRRRQHYLEHTGPLAEGIYRELSSGAEELQISFQPCCAHGEMAELLASARERDQAAGFSTAGPHREDFDTVIAGRSGRSYGSQGQQRSAALSLKLAEAARARSVTGEHPVMLLDDVLSELDEGRQGFLLGRIGEAQSIVTTCDAAAFSRTAGKLVFMQNGDLINSH